MEQALKSIELAPKSIGKEVGKPTDNGWKETLITIEKGEAIQRIQEAVEYAEEWATPDSANSKQYAIDQMLRILLDENGYQIWREEYDSQEDYPEWEEGRAS